MDCWSAGIFLDGKPASFELDTGTSVTVVGESMAKAKKLKPAKKSIRGPGETPLNVLGVFTATPSHKGTAIEETTFVLAHQHSGLLSCSVCTRLGLIARIDSISTPNFKQEFPKLFRGLGNLQKEYSITLKDKDNATPFCLYTPRKAAHPLLPKVKQEINRMLEQGVISPVTGPASWCSGIVVVPKPNVAVRIGIDLTHLNKAVQREAHTVSSVDESVAALVNSKIFSKLDAKSGFWQIPLSKESRLLTTFVTPFGRLCMNRLPFGICSASELFQRTVSEILAEVEAVICHMDGVLIEAADQATHDNIVRQVLRKLSDAGLSLNEKM